MEKCDKTEDSSSANAGQGSDVSNLNDVIVQLKSEGNKCFREGNYEDSLVLYSAGAKICPLEYVEQRAVFFANRAATNLKLEDFSRVVDDCTVALLLKPDYLKVLQRRATTLEKLDKFDESLEDYQKILSIEPSNAEARLAVDRLTELVQERNEKLKEEMLDKLKDVGNLILKPFGLSTNNFRMVKDEKSGSYSINFVNSS
ncbi:tetratricopeptide repeat protein 1 [Phlebotomus argentipes]|uniref:tetratricopeptide repeat protein 1 n=1 Tax=Phlebotomus argentipes TaxID=94469 RepID=UPI0028932970|nr:tetratricopeptide repeat protein 1 [Phlebotomus argentipes]